MLSVSAIRTDGEKNYRTLSRIIGLCELRRKGRISSSSPKILTDDRRDRKQRKNSGERTTWKGEKFSRTIFLGQKKMARCYKARHLSFGVSLSFFFIPDVHGDKNPRIPRDFPRVTRVSHQKPAREGD